MLSVNPGLRIDLPDLLYNPAGHKRWRKRKDFICFRTEYLNTIWLFETDHQTNLVWSWIKLNQISYFKFHFYKSFCRTEYFAAACSTNLLFRPNLFFNINDFFLEHPRILDIMLSLPNPAKKAKQTMAALAIYGTLYKSLNPWNRCFLMITESVLSSLSQISSSSDNRLIIISNSSELFPWLRR